MDVDFIRELALQISGINKIVPTNENSPQGATERGQATDATPAPAPAGAQ